MTPDTADLASFNRLYECIQSRGTKIVANANQLKAAGNLIELCMKIHAKPMQISKACVYPNGDRFITSVSYIDERNMFMAYVNEDRYADATRVRMVLEELSNGYDELA